MRITVLGRRTIINYTVSVSPWTQLTKEHDNEAWQLCLKVHDSPLCFVLDSYTMHKLRNLNVAIGQLLLGNQVFCFGPAKANKLKKQTKKYNKGLSGLITIHIEVIWNSDSNRIKAGSWVLFTKTNWICPFFYIEDVKMAELQVNKSAIKCTLCKVFLFAVFLSIFQLPLSNISRDMRQGPSGGKIYIFKILKSKKNSSETSKSGYRVRSVN